MRGVGGGEELCGQGPGVRFAWLPFLFPEGTHCSLELKKVTYGVAARGQRDLIFPAIYELW